MLSPAEAIIYLADQRGCIETELHRSFHTFNFGDYYRKDRLPFGKLEVLNDETLAGESTVSHIAEEFSSTLLIPLVGKVKYAVDHVPYGSSEAGQMHLISAPPSSIVEIANPYEKELVNFLHLQIITGERSPHVLVRKFDFDIDTVKNTLLHFEPVSTSEASFPRITIGKFEGRQEAELTLKDAAKGAFVFVIEGAFEVENRLLQSRDGLAIRKTETVELEALSNGALILFVE
jgi:redox-sensitive bicupin YhaK (pirin superfamily)